MLWLNTRPDAMSKKKKTDMPGLLLEGHNEDEFLKASTEGLEFLPCPFSGGTAWFSLPLVEKHPAPFSTDLPIALGPYSGCRALSLCGKVSSKAFGVAIGHCAILSQPELRDGVEL